MTRTTRSRIAARGGKSGLFFTYGITQSDATVELYVDHRDEETNREAFRKLMAHQQEIESAFGAPLSWEELKGVRGRRIAYTFRPAVTRMNPIGPSSKMK